MACNATSDDVPHFTKPQLKKLSLMSNIQLVPHCVDIRLQMWHYSVMRRALVVERWRGRAGEMAGAPAGWQNTLK